MLHLVHLFNHVVFHLPTAANRSILRDAKVLSTHSRMKSFAIIVSPPRVAAQSFTADLSSSAMISERMIVNFCIALWVRCLGLHLATRLVCKVTRRIRT